MKGRTECERGVFRAKRKRERITGSQRREYSYSWLTGLPIRDGKDAVIVNWINIKISLPGGRTTYNASFITDLHPDAGNIVELAACARAR